jgi:hypothetical protein
MTEKKITLANSDPFLTPFRSFENFEAEVALNFAYYSFVKAEPCPFQIDHRYKVLRDYSFLNHAFRAGNHLVFTSFAYSPKEGVTRYWFKHVGSGETNAWHVFESEEAETDWRQTFEPV